MWTVNKQSSQRRQEWRAMPSNQEQESLQKWQWEENSTGVGEGPLPMWTVNKHTGWRKQV
jgi:hypothetical protein